MKAAVCIGALYGVAVFGIYKGAGFNDLHSFMAAAAVFVLEIVGTLPLRN